MGTLTMKFGGTTVGTTTALSQVVSIILQEYERQDQLIIVASALEGVTDALIEAAQLAGLSNRRGYRRIVATVRTRHLALVEKLPLNANERTSLNANIDNLLFDMLDICQSMSDYATEDSVPQQTIDAVIGVGEQLAARIVAALIRSKDLRSVHIDATQIVITDDQFGNARPNLEATRQRMIGDVLPMLERGIIPVITGFIGSTPDGRPTTLGRGGSDYTASVAAACLDADEVWMWTDVDGMMSTDPREFPAAQVINELSYEEVAELAYFGARIVHTNMIGLLRQRNIPLCIKNVYRPQQPGTLIHAISNSDQNRIKAVTSIQGVGLTATRSGSMAKIYELIDSAVKESTGSPADVTISAQSSARTFICVVIPPHIGPEGTSNTQQKLVQYLDNDPEVADWEIELVGVITVIGRGISEYPRLIARIFDVLDDMPVLAMSQGPDAYNLSLVVNLADAQTAVERLHVMTIESE